MAGRRTRGMLWLATVALVAGLTVPATISDGQVVAEQPAAAPTLPGLRLVFDDEFTGPGGAPPSPANWVAQTGGWGWGWNELESYTARTANAHLDGNGHLAIVARRESFTGADGVTRHYTSARLIVRPVLFTYGYVAIRARIPAGMGLWPAFWGLGGDPTGADWPIDGEFDVLECVNYSPKAVTATVHGPTFGAHQNLYAGIAGHWQVVGATVLPQPVSAGFHTFALRSAPGRLSFSVDGRPYFTFSRNDLPKGASWPFDNAFHLILDLAVGGYGGSPVATDFPQALLVDYVRVYAPSGDVSRATAG